MNVLIWFRRDLRVTDHPALAAAAGAPVLPLFIVDPAQWALPERSARQWDFVAETLGALREELRGLGAPLAVRIGDPVTVLAKLCRQHRIGRILALAPRSAVERAEDRRVADWAREAGIGWELLAEGEAEAGALQAVSGVEPGPIPSARVLRLAEDRCAHRQAGGRGRGLLLLESFLGARGEGYRDCDGPASGERGCSRLSPHLAWGALSRREVLAAVAARQAERPGGGWGRSLAAFQAALTRRAVEVAPEDDGDTALLAAFAAGETGLPFVDAGMRYLAATGWQTARMRGLLAAVAVQHLGLPEAAAGRVLARLSTDYDPAIHWSQMRRVAEGRIANPLALAEELDPAGSFTRRWLPELAPVPDARLQAPWKWVGAGRLLGRRYPEPVVDPASAARAARERLRWRMAEEVLEGLDPPRRPGPAAQLRLDL